MTAEWQTCIRRKDENRLDSKIYYIRENHVSKGEFFIGSTPSAKNFPLNFCLKLERQAKSELHDLFNDPTELEKGVTNIFIKALLILDVKRSSYENVEWKEVSTTKGALHRDCPKKIKKIRETLTAVSWELNRLLELKGFVNKSHNFHSPDAQPYYFNPVLDRENYRVRYAFEMFCHNDQ